MQLVVVKNKLAVAPRRSSLAGEEKQTKIDYLFRLIRLAVSVGAERVVRVL